MRVHWTKNNIGDSFRPRFNARLIPTKGETEMRKVRTPCAKGDWLHLPFSTESARDHPKRLKFCEHSLAPESQTQVPYLQVSKARQLQMIVIKQHLTYCISFTLHIIQFPASRDRLD